jgi:hypothetical protein
LEGLVIAGGGGRAKEDDIKKRGPLPEPVFVNVEGALEFIPEESIPAAYVAWRAEVGIDTCK